MMSDMNENLEYMLGEYSEMSKERLITELIRQSTQVNIMLESIRNWHESSAWSMLASALTVECNQNTKDMVEWLNFLIRVANASENAISIDKRAMWELALRDPGAYAQAVICRRQCHSTSDIERGKYRYLSENRLSLFTAPKVSVNTPFSTDHAVWASVIEQFDLNERIERLTPVLN